jgi:dTDP-4-amino-4,6-dideoxygalactose transaminase
MMSVSVIICEMVIRELENEGVVARRYFHPALNTLPFVGNNTRCPISEDVSEKVVCIPVHQELTYANINQIADIINGCSD